MTECLFQYDRLYLNAAYHEPDEHRHLLSHIIVGVDKKESSFFSHYDPAMVEWFVQMVEERKNR